MSILHWVKFLIRGLDKDDQIEGLFKRLKDIREMNEKQIEVIKGQGEKQLDRLKNIADSKSLKTISYFGQLGPEAKELFERIKKENNDTDPEKLVCAKADNRTAFNFNVFKT